MTPDQYADALQPLCMRLIATVHDEGPDAVAGALAAIRALPAPQGIQPADAVAVILAAAVRPDATRHQLWGWTDQLGAGATVPTGHTANALAREMALAGTLPLSALTPAEAADVIDTLIGHRGWTIDATAAHLDTEPANVARIRHNQRRRHNRSTKDTAA
ncbi:hypothetical protein [Actinophytocola sediminis]